MRFHGLFVVLGAVLALLPCRVQAAGNFSISELLPLIPDCAVSHSNLYQNRHLFVVNGPADLSQLVIMYPHGIIHQTYCTF